MKLRKQKLLSLFIAATLATTPAISANVVCGEEFVAEETAAEGTIAEEAEAAVSEEFTEEADTLGEEFVDAPEEFAENSETGQAEVFESESEAEAPTVESVEALIGALPELSNVTEEKRQDIEAALAAYNQLSTEDQKKVDEDMGNKSSQSYGRDLETAVWGLKVLEQVDASTTLPDGIYDASTSPALSSEYSKGKSNSSRQKPWSLKDVTVKNGQAVATVMVQSTGYTSIRTNGQTYEKTNTSGNSEFANVPVDLNGTMYIAAYSTSMKGEIAFTVTNTIDEPKCTPIADSAITNTTAMFKVIDAFIMEDASGKFLYVTLSGTGYQELFKGTYEEAVATGDDASKWIVGSKRADGTEFDGKYQFAIPISADDGYMQIQALSNSHKKDGHWWYPRYLRLDQSALTLESGDYKETFDLTVTNNVKMFLVKEADLTIVGGPHSNGYQITSDITMGSTSFDKAFIGTAAKAEDSEETIDLSEDKKFHFTVENIVGTGNDASIHSILDDPTVISFHSVKNDIWYERIFSYNKADRTLVIDESSKADYTAVDAALATVPEDLSIYTEATAAEVTTAKNNVKTGLYASQQEKVDAMAKAIRDAVAALKKKPEEEPSVTPPAPTEAPKPTVTPEPTATPQPTVTPKLEMNAVSVPLQVKKSTSAIKVSGLNAGEKIVSWKSSKTSVATVSKNGKITAKKTGKTKITAKTSYGRSVSVTVSVQKKAVTTKKLKVVSATKGVTIKKNSLSIKKGKKVALRTSVDPVTSTSKVTYKSSDKKIVTVSSKGKLTAKKPGKAKITITSGNVKVSLKVTVTKK